MTDEAVSVPIDLITTPLFDKKHNISYNDSDFNDTAKWQIVISNNCPDNLADCLNSNGLLNSSVTVSATADIKLHLEEVDDYNSYVTIADNVTVSLSDDVDMKGLFLRKKSNNFVLMGMINQTTMRFCDGITFEKDNVLFIKRR